MLNQLNAAFPLNASERQKNRYLLAIRLAAMTATPTDEKDILPHLGRFWKQSDDPLRRRIGKIIEQLSKYKQPANQHTIHMIWKEINNTVWQRDQEAAKAAILKFAKYVAAQENRVGDVTGMPEEQAHRTLRRLAGLNDILNALAAWWEQEQDLWAAVLEHQRQEADRLEEYKDELARLARENITLKKDLITLRQLYDNAAAGEALFVEILAANK